MSLGALIVLAWLVPLSTRAQDAQEIHDRIAAVMARSGLQAPAADTFVTWSPSPVLFHTVTRRSDRIQTALIRPDRVVGVADVTFGGDAPTAGHVTWRRPGQPTRDVRMQVIGDSLVVQDSSRHVYGVPNGPWSIADYGMDDLLIPALAAMTPGTRTRIAVFRPYGVKWDTLMVRRRESGGRVEVEIESAPDDLWTLVLGADGAILQIVRTKYPDSERRPLEQSRRMSDYLRKRRPLPAKR